MRILVTGSSGFVGRHVTKELESLGHELLTPSSRELNLLNPFACSGINGGPVKYGMPITNAPLAYMMEGTDALMSYLIQREVDAVVHLAATCGGIGINKDNPGRFIYENLQMGINILEAARLAGVSKVVNLGTVCMYPKHTPVPFQEKDIYNGYPEETNAPYGIAKRTIVEMGIAYSSQYNMDITNLIPVNMAGEWDNFDEYSSHVIPALIKKFEYPHYRGGIDKNGQEFRGVMMDESDGVTPVHPFVTLWGTGSASREFLDAKDCARAIGVALEKNTGPDPINLGTGREITIKDLAELIKKVGGYDAEIVWDPTKPDGQPRRSLDITRAKNVLRWEPSVTLENTLKRTIDWYREHKI